ncbi:PREDICTED: uncharacterized protein LOC104604807 [Nelumbo nucifera]|uniref:Uncharacterized protein LOC104604807 n=1 Tax=Nelumbo nucifera TaxID=4432 RepID=A0A1U8Q6X2_NELNU|nr:PREDICTED: uncharacterized protein LOC104604807 [Nelumbo nucifera]
MAFDQSSTQKGLRQLDVARMVTEETRDAVGLATGRNTGGFLPNSARDVGSPRSRQPLYYAATVPDIGYVGLGFANPMMAWCSRPLVLIGIAGGVPVGYTEFPNVGNRVGGNGANRASNEGGEESVSRKKVKFLCSFGGKILPRPSDGMLRYVGGQTGIIGMKRDICFQELVQKMTDIYGQSVHIKTQEEMNISPPSPTSDNHAMVGDGVRKLSLGGQNAADLLSLERLFSFGQTTAQTYTLFTSSVSESKFASKKSMQ